MTKGSLTHGLFRAVVNHPVAVSMAFLAAIVFGWVSYQRLAVELMPDISYPTITVRTAYEGAAPQEVETQISRRIEESLATLDGLVSIESRSRAGNSDVVLGFDWGTDMAQASQTIRENLQSSWLAPEAERPLILHYDPSLEPFLRLVLWMDAENVAEGVVLPEGDAALFMLRNLAEDEIKRELESMKGVAAVRVKGGLEREIHVNVREDWLAARQVTLDGVEAALQSENINVAGGSIIEGDVEYLIRTINEYTTIDELRSLRIRRNDGVLVPLTDVAQVTATHRERDVISRLNGGAAVELEIFKEADVNVVSVANRLKKELDGDKIAPQYAEYAEQMGLTPGLVAGLPDGVALTIVDDQAAFIESAVLNLRNTAFIGGFFAVFVLFLFLRDFRATAIIGVAIPLSILIGFAPLYMLDISLNLMSLGGLALGVGMLVDNAVVVLESIQRYREEGQNRCDASINGAGDVAVAVVASTLTTVAVFLPISFVEGIAGELFGDLSMAVVSSLLASLFVALFGVPTMAAVDLSALGTAQLGGSIVGLLERGGQSLTGWLWTVVSGAWRWTWAGPRAGWSAWREWTRAWRIRWVTLPYAVVRFLGHLFFSGGFVLFALSTAVAVRLFIMVLVVAVYPAAGLLMWMAGRFQAIYLRFTGRYVTALATALRGGGGIVVSALLLLAVSAGVVGTLGTELIPEIHQGRFTAELALPVGTPLERTAIVVAEAEQIVKSNPNVETVYTAIGADLRADARADEGEHTARLRIQLKRGGDWATREALVMEQLRSSLGEIPRLESKMVRPVLFSFKTPVEVVIFGYDLDILRESGDRVVSRLDTVDGLRDVRSSLVRGHPEVQIHYDRMRLHRLGLDAATVASRVRDKIQGVEATRIHEGDKRISLMVQLEENDRATLDDLERINVNPNLIPAIPLSAVADFEETIGPSEIRRVDQQRAVVVSANLEGFDLGSAGADIAETLQGLHLDDSVYWSVAGQSLEMQESLASLQFALGLAVFLVYVIMASTFESLVHPLVILFSVPLAAVGAVAGLFMVGSPISVVVLIGGIVLAGVVVNNAIVLVDCINRFRDDGEKIDDAIRRAAALRVRPILITTATTVLGLFPLALGFGAGAEMQAPLAVTVIGGLLSSTLLTLIVIPVVYRMASPGEAHEPAPLPPEGEIAG